MTGKHGFSGPRPPSAPAPSAPALARRQIRLGPPANDNVRLGGLRFTGLRWVIAVALALMIVGALRVSGIL